MTVRHLRPITDPSQTPDDLAAYWLTRHEVTPRTAEDPLFVQWLAASPENQAAWARAQTLWSEAATTLAEHPLSEALRASARAARPSPWPTWAMAAGLAIAVIGAGVGALAWRHGQTTVVAAADPLSTLGTPDFATAKGGRLTTQLADGTRLELDTDSAVDVAIDGQRRRLRLVRGQAFVTVGADKRPFSMEVGDQTIVDRGTAFAARLDAAVVSVTLTSGQVVVGPTGSSPAKALAPGQRLVVRPGKAAEVQAIDAESVLAWREGFVQFSNTPLAQAIEELNRYSGQRLVVRDPKVAAMKTSGRFKLGDPERFVRNASELLPIRAVSTSEGLEIRSTGSPRSALPRT
jgi:transmembrane sensor